MSFWFQGIKDTDTVCVLCCQKIQISQTFKKSSEKSLNMIKVDSCLFCKNDSDFLVATNTNSSGFMDSLQLFLNIKKPRRVHLESAVCFECIYKLHIWCEIKLQIIKKVRVFYRII